MDCEELQPGTGGAAVTYVLLSDDGGIALSPQLGEYSINTSDITDGNIVARPDLFTAEEASEIRAALLQDRQASPSSAK